MALAQSTRLGISQSVWAISRLSSGVEKGNFSCVVNAFSNFFTSASCSNLPSSRVLKNSFRSKA